MTAALRGAGASFLLSTRRMRRSKFLWGNLFTAAIPLLIVSAWGLSGYRNLNNINTAHVVYEMFLRTLFLHYIVFFVGGLFGFAVMRQEFDDQTLHYLLLQPIGRWVLIAGKLAACMVLASGICIASLWLTYLLMTLPKFGLGAVVADLFGEEGRFLILVKESLVIILALLAYSTIGMLMGSFFKSTFYALVILAWETGLPYMPVALKYWTVMFYVQSLLPEKLAEQRKIFELLGEPASPAMSVGVICGVSTVFILFCTVLFQVRECMYKET